jgi:beta-lactamase class A
VTYHSGVLGSSAGGLAVHWMRGAVLLGGLFASVGTVMLVATPVPTTGRVVDVGGRPVAGAEVQEIGDLLTPSGDARSDADGRYHLSAPRWPTGAERLVVQAAGFEPAQGRAGGLLVLHRWPALSGRVVDDVGGSLPGAVVTVTSRSAVVRAAMTDLDGRFELTVPRLAGDATVTALADQHDPVSRTVLVGVDRAPSVQLSLARQLATLHVESDPAGLAPQVDGLAAPDCQATPCDVMVLSGAHHVSFVSDQFMPWDADVNVERNGTAAVHAQLEHRTGTLDVNAPDQGELTVDGQAVKAGPWSGTLPIGQHTVVYRSATTWPATVRPTVEWNKATQVSITAAAVAPGDQNAFGAGLRAYLAAQGRGTFGVYLEDVGTGATVGSGDTAAMEAASVIKVPEALYLLHQADGGQVNLSDQIDLHAEDFMSGTGSLYSTAHAGDKFSYQQLLALLIQQSDNTAWQALDRVLGERQVDAYAASLGAGDCVQRTDACSARSAGRLLGQLARGRILGGGSTRLLLNLLEATIFNDRIPYYLGGTAVAHKVGMDPGNGVANDCGVVFQSSGNPVVVCVFTTTGNPDNGAQVIRDIARAAVQLW